ncbi:hypothetical protein [Methanothermobacter sp. KEPCO-1]|nr:hypothetical protein [Methanothermobacter sp. KEPCO-1]
MPENKEAVHMENESYSIFLKFSEGLMGSADFKKQVCIYKTENTRGSGN